MTEEVNPVQFVHTLDDLLREHVNENKFSGLVDVMQVTDPSSVTSMARNIAYKRDADAKKDDVVFNIISVVREPTSLLMQCETEEEIDNVMQVVFTVANQVVHAWYLIACAVYEGQEDLLKYIDFEISDLPPRIGASTITVFGNMVDSAGRFSSVTLTDQSVLENVAHQIRYSFGLYDEITRLSGGNTFGSYGNNTYRNTTVLGAKRSTKKSSKSNSSGPKIKIGSKMKSGTSDEYETVNYDEQLMRLEAGDNFEAQIGKVNYRIKPNGSVLSFKLLQKDGSLSDTDVFVYDGRNEFPVLIDKLKELEIIKDDTQNIDVEAKLKIRSTKLVSAKTNNAYYVNTEIVST